MQHRRENKVAIAQSLADRLAEEALATAEADVAPGKVRGAAACQAGPDVSRVRAVGLGLDV
jgi:hypothetical protein